MGVSTAGEVIVVTLDTVLNNCAVCYLLRVYFVTGWSYDWSHCVLTCSLHERAPQEVIPFMESDELALHGGLAIVTLVFRGRCEQ